MNAWIERWFGEGAGRAALPVVLGALMMATLSAAVILLPPTAQVGLVIGVVALGVFYARPGLALTTFFLFRIVLDILWWLPGNIGSLNLMELYTGGVTVLCATLLLIDIRRVERHPCLPAFFPYAVVLIFGGVRNLELRSAAEILARYISPFLLMFLLSVYIDNREARRRFFRWTLFIFSIPVAVSLYQLLRGQMNTYTLAGYNRLLGGYKNLHTHALMMLVISASALWSTMWATVNKNRKEQALFAAFTGGALISMYFTYVRTALLALAISGAVYLLVTGRTRILVGGALLVFTFILFTPAMQDRFKDLILFIAPDDNVLVRRKLGSGRMAIWTAAITEYVKAPLGDILLGLGIGKHWLLTRGAFNPYSMASDGYVDPHSDYLTMTFQVGPIATISYLAMQIQVVRSGLIVYRNSPDRHARELAAFNIALTAGATVANMVSNSFINRISVGWMAWGLASLTFGEHLQLIREGALKPKLPTWDRAAPALSHARPEWTAGPRG